MTDNITLGNFFDIYSYDFMYKPAEEVQCNHCGWSGVLKDTKQEHINTGPETNTPTSAWLALTGREGYEYFCPACNWIVKANYSRIS